MVKHSELPSLPHPVSAAAIAGVCIGGLVFVIAASVVAYKCYRKQIQRNAQNRLSSAIKKGLKESNNGSMKKGHRGSTLMKSKATSPIFPPSHDIGSSERGVIMRGLPTDGSNQGNAPECHVENEKDGATPEKEEQLQGKQAYDDKPQKLGNLFFSVEYDEQKTALLVSILRAAELPPRDPSLGGCDPYVKLQLLPEKKHKCKTRVLRKTQNPDYDETFTFYGITPNQLQGITLHFVVLSFDRFSRDEIIGEVIHPLSGEDMEQKDVALSKEIKPRYLKRNVYTVTLCGWSRQ